MYLSFYRRKQKTYIITRNYPFFTVFFVGSEFQAKVSEIKRHERQNP